MLHAIEKNKSKLYERYWGVRDFHDRGNITAEDEITSTLFGPLDFMSTSDVWRIAINILGDKAPSVTPTRFELKFWKKLDDIEPDVELIFFHGEEPIVAILFELKWNASLSGDDQLIKQWDNFEYKEHPNSYHVFIAKENAVNKVANSFASPGWENKWGDRLICLPWCAVQVILENILKVAVVDSRALMRWAQLSQFFLQRALGSRPFGGFGMSLGVAPECFGVYLMPDFAAFATPLYWDDH